MAGVGGAIAAWWGALGTGTQVGAAALGSTALGAGVSALTKPSMPHIGVPPPPGAALIDPAGQQAAGDARRRAAASGGLASTIGAGAGQPTSATGGGKSLLGG